MMTMASFLFLVTFLLLFSLCQGQDELETYIVHVDRQHDHDFESWYRSFLPDTVANAVESRLVYSYTNIFSGFAVRLTKEELTEMAAREGFIGVYPNTVLPLLTTHTPDFLGLRLGSSGLWNASNLGKGVVIGMLDTGIVPDHPSFCDDGVPPPPTKWKGKCELDTGCNNKIIGARMLLTNDPPATKTDEVGHGTHTASTAAGNFVENVDAFGLRGGTVAGIAPHAHLAIYKVCSLRRCYQADILAGMDSAVEDGVDIISFSIGGALLPYDRDPIAIGAFAAMERGIVVVCAAGNFGPGASTLSHEAPWILVVGASTVDRSFRSVVTLGNGRQFNGETIPQPANFSSGPFPIFFAGKGEDNRNAATCYDLNRKRPEGSIVVCESGSNEPVDKGYSVRSCKGVGMVSISAMEEGYTREAHWFPLPATQVTYTDGTEIIAYVASDKSPNASIAFNGTVLGTSPAPTVAFFSSRGPGQQSPGILRPDITAPGVNILAAWQSSATDPEDYQILSGTSMAAPHVAGIAALVKSVHPDWSPAAIKSAILTSSDAIDQDGNPIKDENYVKASFFAMGAGHVNPSSAAEPGLVYDLNADDYIEYLCGLGLNESAVKAILQRPNATCSGVKHIAEAELNYPSITVTVSSCVATVVNRTVTNVGEPDAMYNMEVDVPEEVTVMVEPKILQFSTVNEKKTYTITVTSSGDLRAPAEGNLKWVSRNAAVRSPVIIKSISPSKP